MGPSEHTDFSESTEEIAPLTEEEKKVRLEELRQKLKEKRANQSVTDREEQKRNEVIPSPRQTPQNFTVRSDTDDPTPSKSAKRPRKSPRRPRRSSSASSR